MKLFQLLMLVHSGCGILLFDINGVEIFRCRDKEAVPIELNEYDVLEISANWRDLKTKESALYITLQK